MSRTPSDATQLKSERRMTKELRAELTTVSAQLTAYRGRASKAEAEAAEWKRRFDALLKIVPEVPRG